MNVGGRRSRGRDHPAQSGMRMDQAEIAALYRQMELRG